MNWGYLGNSRPPVSTARTSDIATLRKRGYSLMAEEAGTIVPLTTIASGAVMLLVGCCLFWCVFQPAIVYLRRFITQEKREEMH